MLYLFLGQGLYRRKVKQYRYIHEKLYMAERSLSAHLHRLECIQIVCLHIQVLLTMFKLNT